MFNPSQNSDPSVNTRTKEGGDPDVGEQTLDDANNPLREADPAERTQNKLVVHGVESLLGVNLKDMVVRTGGLDGQVEVGEQGLDVDVPTSARNEAL